MEHVYIIAEIGCNHNGDIKLAKKLVEKAKECSVDAVKFQTFKAKELISRYAPKAEYQKLTTNMNESQLEMTEKLELRKEDYLSLRTYAESLGLDVFSTAFDMDSVQFLADENQEVWKIPSGEITNLPYLEKIGRLKCKNKKIIVSTGMALIEEVKKCLNILEKNGTKKEAITILHCNTEYPTPDEDVNLTAIKDIRRNFPEYMVGFSDHSKGYVAAVGAVVLGATVVEKHFTMDKNLPGPDHKASATPFELKELVDNIRRIEKMYGCNRKVVTDSERKNMVVARKSIVAKKKIYVGERFSEDNIICKRPGNGISPMEWHQIIGKISDRDFEADELITCEGIKWQQ